MNFNFSFELIAGQIFLGLVNGAFLALLSLGLSLIFGLLNIVKFFHGSFFMLGAFSAWYILEKFQITYFPALLGLPIIGGLLSWPLEKFLIRRTYKMEASYSLLLTFGLTLIAEGLLREKFGVSGMPYPIPSVFEGFYELGNIPISIYRVWVLFFAFITCLATFICVEKSSLGASLRALREDSFVFESLGYSSTKWRSFTFAIGSSLAVIAGILAAPIYQVKPTMGSEFIIQVFAVVVVGGMGSLGGSILSAFILGTLEGVSKLFFPEISSIVIFIAMALILLFFKNGLKGRTLNA